MSRALVLNATYEPLCVVSERRAVVLVLGEKADIIHETDTLLHSEQLTIAVPSVVRLRYFVRVPFRRRAPLTRRAVFLRDGHRCQYCSRPAESIDHVVPRSRGGAHSWGNVVAACRRCNSQKRDRLLDETTMRLRAEPREPDRLSWVRVAASSRVPEHWEPYLAQSA